MRASLSRPLSPRACRLGALAPRLGLSLGLGIGLGGCGVHGLAQKEADTAAQVEGVEGEDEAPLAIAGFEPAWSPLMTETAVLVSGRGFVQPVRFWFGNSEVDVQHVNDNRIRVRTPAVRAEGAVPVRVETALGELEIDDAFLFSDSPPAVDTGGDGSAGDGGGDGGSGGGEGGGDASGLVSGYTELGLYVVGCPSCLGFTGSVVGEAYSVLHAPMRGAWMSWLPRTGSCVNDPRRELLSSTGLNLGSSVFLQGGAGGLALNRVSDGGLTYYLASGLGTADLPYNTSFDLTAPSASPPFTVTGAVRSVRDAFDAFEPIDMLSDGAYAFADLSAGYARFDWAPVGVSDAMMINIQVYDSSTGAYRGEILCAAADSGSFVVPSSAFAPYYAYDLAAIWVYRWSMSEGLNPIDGSTHQGASAVGLIGTATLVP